jgi:hypothetical protein
MQLEHFVAALRARGVPLSREGDWLVVEPDSKPTEIDRDFIRANKPKLIALLDGDMGATAEPRVRAADSARGLPADSPGRTYGTRLWVAAAQVMEPGLLVSMAPRISQRHRCW